MIKTDVSAQDYIRIVLERLETTEYKIRSNVTYKGQVFDYVAKRLRFEIDTKKGGRRKPQPIPESLVPLFNVPINPITECTLNRRLKKLCKQAKIFLPRRGGFHSIRRRVVTELTKIETSEISIHHFMRWAVPRQFVMLSRYRQTPVEESDNVILEKYPFVKLWEEVKPYIFLQNRHYTGNFLNDKI